CYDFGFGYTCTSTPAPVNSPICPKTIFKGKQQINGTTDYFRYESTFEPIWFKETGFSTEVCPDGRSLASVLCRYDGRNPAFYDPTTIDISLCGQNLADVELAVTDFKYLTFSPTKLQQFMGIVQLMVSSPQNITVDNITVATNLSETLADTIPGNTANSSDVTAHAARGVLLLANHLNIAYGNPNYNLTQILKEMGNI
uniref:Uncharacterized protein n=1 Tax=Ciona savignyi TaxID=51511 RepID=H2Z1G6_CIOSA